MYQRVPIGELLALRCRAVDRDRTCSWVVEAGDRSRFYSPKTHRSRRPILLTDEDMKRLTEFRWRIMRAGEDDRLFLNRFGTGPIHADKALETLQSAAKRVGISYATWHLLRDWHTTALHDEGVSMKAAQDRLGVPRQHERVEEGAPWGEGRAHVAHQGVHPRRCCGVRSG